jgi:hypothetical protein
MRKNKWIFFSYEAQKIYSVRKVKVYAYVDLPSWAKSDVIIKSVCSSLQRARAYSSSSMIKKGIKTSLYAQ